MSTAVICDKCGKVFKLRDALIVDILKLHDETIFSGHLCKSCKQMFNVQLAGTEIVADEATPYGMFDKYKYK